MEIAIAGVSGVALGIVAVVAMFVMGKRAADAERRAGEQSTRATNSDGKLLAATVANDALALKCAELEKTNAAIQTVLASTADDLPPGESRARLHARWFALHHPGEPATRTASGTVHVPAGPHTAGSDELLKPGE